jgi:hypothetical protein
MRLLLRLATLVFLVGWSYYSFYLLGGRRGPKQQRDVPRDRYRRRKVVESSVIADDTP